MVNPTSALGYILFFIAGYLLFCAVISVICDERKRFPLLLFSGLMIMGLKVIDWGMPSVSSSKAIGVGILVGCALAAIHGMQAYENRRAATSVAIGVVTMALVLIF